MTIPATSPDTPGTPDQPVGQADRIVALDFIRGVAVLGILLPNIVSYSYPMLAYYWPPALDGGPTEFDRWTWLAQLVLVDGKLRGLFTLLFGVGIALFMDRARARGATAWLQARRLGWLALFGLAHYYLLWTGDILFLYAVSGLVVLAMLDWEPRTQLGVGIAWAIGGALLMSAMQGGAAAIEVSAALQAQQPQAYEAVRQGAQNAVSGALAETGIMRGGSYGEIVWWRLQEETLPLLRTTQLIAPLETVPLMLLGIALYRLGLFGSSPERGRLRRWAWAGLTVGALLTLPLGLWVMEAGFPLYLTQFVFNGAAAVLHLPMVLGLAALLALWAPAAASTALGNRVAAAGRMAFTNYVGTSAVMMLIFQGWAGGLYGTLHRAELLAFVLLGWALMLAWSQPWLARFRYGPLEWLWRCLTYGQKFPMRR